MKSSKEYFVLGFLILALAALLYSVLAQEAFVYKTTESGKELLIKSLKQNPYVPSKSTTPAVIMLSGGGWVDFQRGHLRDLGKYLAEKGAQVFIVEYRTSKAFPEATPMDALDDVHDAIFYLRERAAELQIDPEKFVAVGASAGGQLAFASCLANPRKLTPISSYLPNYIAAYSPVIRNDSSGYAFERIGAENARWFSPWNVYMESEARLPPSIVFSGEDDNLIDIEDLRSFNSRALEKGDVSELVGFENAGHSMRNKIPDIYEQTGPQIIAFLNNHGLEFPPSSNRRFYFIAGLFIGTILFIVLVIRRRRLLKH